MYRKKDIQRTLADHLIILRNEADRLDTKKSDQLGLAQAAREICIAISIIENCNTSTQDTDDNTKF